MNQSFDLVILGAGPAGYVAAIRAGQLGLKTAVVEAADLGGICLNYGCIPTKALLKSAEMLHWMTHDAKAFGLTVKGIEVDFKAVIARSRTVAGQLNKGVGGLLKKQNVTVLKGYGSFKNANTLIVKTQPGQPKTVSFKHALIATGASPRHLPGLEPDGTLLITSKEAMLLDAPPKRLGIIGAGAIGAEFAYFFAQFGSEVTLIEAQDRILPLEDEEASQVVTRAFKKNGITLQTNALVSKAEKKGQSVILTIGDSTQTFDKVLVSVGVQGNTQGLGCETVGIQVDKGHIKVNNTLQTTVPNIYAVGDVIGAPWLAHVASHEAITAVEHLAGLKPKPMNYEQVPACTYCQPQVASVGLTESQAKKKHAELKVGKFPFRANGKALAAGYPDGFVKLIFAGPYRELVGAHLVGHDVTEMMSTFTVMMAAEATQAEIIHAIHPHPTCSEAILEAALDADGRVLHL